MILCPCDAIFGEYNALNNCLVFILVFCSLFIKCLLTVVKLGRTSNTPVQLIERVHIYSAIPGNIYASVESSVCEMTNNLFLGQFTSA